MEENYIKDMLAVGKSRTELGLCKNENCKNSRRNGAIKSAYCQECSDNNKINQAL